MIDKIDGNSQQGAAAKQAPSGFPATSSPEPVGTSNQTLNRPEPAQPSGQNVERATKDLDSIRVAEWWLICIQVCVLITGIVVCVIYGKQLTVMKGQFTVMQGQLNEMKSGSADTHDLAISAGKQADAAKSQTDTMSKSLKKTDSLINATIDLAKQGKRSADAAAVISKANQEIVITSRRNLGLAEQSLIAQERPWVGLESFSGTVEAGKPITGNIAFRNYGKSPAFDVLMNTACSYGIDPQHFFEGTYTRAETISTSIMMPNSLKTSDAWSCKINLTPIQIQRAEQGLGVIYMFGAFTYKDRVTAGKGTEHVTKFCGRWNPSTKIFDDCPFYNTAN